MFQATASRKALMTPPHHSKRQLRAHYRALRASLTASERQERSDAICRMLTHQPAYVAARTIHCYMPLPTEVNTRPLIMHALAYEKRVIVPVIEPQTNALSHAVLTSLAAEWLHNDGYGVAVPRPFYPVMSDVAQSVWDVVVVPLLAFDHMGMRLGYGKGYYDRLLTDARAASATTIGVAFACQETDSVPAEPHDVPLQCIITEQGVIACALARKTAV